MQKIIINNKHYGAVALPDTENAYKILQAVKNAFLKKKAMSVALLFSKSKIKSLGHYQRGGAQQELLELAFYIELGSILRFNTDDAHRLKNSIETVNDMAYSNLNITKRLALFNKQQRSRTDAVYLFWDIENFSNVGPMFTHLIEKYGIPDEHIYIAANPDSLYLFKDEWEADLYDYKKSLKSFNFTKCGHGKNIADRVLLDGFRRLAPKASDVYIITYDRELKELFNDQCDASNNLYVLTK